MSEAAPTEADEIDLRRDSVGSDAESSDDEATPGEPDRGRGGRTDDAGPVVSSTTQPDRVPDSRDGDPTRVPNMGDRSSVPDDGQGQPYPGPVSGSGSGPALPFYLPGAGSGPVLGPLATPQTIPSTVPSPVLLPLEPEADREPEPEPEIVAEEPDPDEAGCPNLNLYPIGGFELDSPQPFVALSPLFRELAPVEWTNPKLVCGYPMEPWRDMVIQRLVVGGSPDGALIAAADGSSIVLRVTETEWTSYRLRYGGGPTGPNLVGFPLGRSEIGGVPVILTTNGAVFFAQTDSLGVPLLGGAWDAWHLHGGPDGQMGLPVGPPEAAAGSRGEFRWTEGLTPTGARQDFANGWLFMPGVMTDIESMSQPADSYLWYDEADPEPEAFDYRGQIMQASGASYYVDLTGIRHWIPTTAAWSCAVWDLGATEYAVAGFELDRYPLGVKFVCDDYRKQ